MSTWIGDLDTPVPLVDVDRLERNLERMARHLATTSAGHRPHTKTHKTREVAQRQLAHGAQGLAVAKLGEAEAFVEAGFDDILIAYPLIGDTKLRRLLPLLEAANVRFTVDSAVGARAASAILGGSGRSAEVLIEVEAGARRTGVQSIEEAVELAELVASLPGLDVAGVMTFGRGYVDGAEAQAEVGHHEATVGVEAAAALRAAGHAAPIVSTGCTTTSQYAAQIEGVTEVRAGNYAFRDCKQVSMGVGTFDECALTVLSTVVSHPRERRYILDAGMKALAGEDYGWGTFGQLLEYPDVVVSWAAEEHGVIDVPGDVADPGLNVGERVRIIPNHACGTSNMHDELLAVEGERVVETWPVIGRGRVR